MQIQAVQRGYINHFSFKFLPWFSNENGFLFITNKYKVFEIKIFKYKKHAQKTSRQSYYTFEFLLIF